MACRASVGGAINLILVKINIYVIQQKKQLETIRLRLIAHHLT